MIKGYKALLDRNSIHNCDEMKALQKSSNFMQTIIDTLSRVEGQIDENLSDVKNCLLNVENKAIQFLEMLEQDLDRFLETYNHERNNEENEEFEGEAEEEEDQEMSKILKIRENNVENVKNKELSCSCGFQTNIEAEYSKHMTKVHKSSNYYLNSSHFISNFGNVIQTPLIRQNVIHTPLIREINCEEKVSVIKTPIRSRGRPKIDRGVSEDVTKTKPRTQSTENIKTIKLSTSQNLRRLNDSREEPIQFSSEGNLGSSENYYCGGCMNYFNDYRGFSLHLRTHGFIIHPSSSHIIVRRKNKPAYALSVKGAEKSTERFSCACSSHKNMSYSEYIAHVFKWHLGITPRK